MRVLLQRVKQSKVRVDGRVEGAAGKGLLLFVGIHPSDTQDRIEWMSRKVLRLRIFEDEQGKMNRSIKDVGGDILVVSQFTLYGDASKGTRPSFVNAAGPEQAEDLYNRMIDYLKEHSSLRIESGRFGAMMEVELLNDGPVTLMLEK